MNLPISIPAAADLDEYTTPGLYFCAENGSTVQNTPASAGSFSLIVEKTGAWGTGIKQTFTHFSTGQTYQRVLGYDTSGTKGPWVPLATATPPQVYDLPLAEGLTGTAIYCKTQEGVVLIRGWVKGAEAPAYAKQVTIATLPAGFRPSGTIRHILAVSSAVPEFGLARAEILNTGEIVLFSWNEVGNITNGVSVDMVFQAD